MKKIIIAAIIIAVAAITWFIFVKRPVFLNRFFPQKTADESAKLPEANPFKTNTNPFSDSYKNPFSNQ